MVAEENQRLQEFDKKNRSIPEAEDTAKEIKSKEMTEEERSKDLVVKELTNTDHTVRDVEKKEWIKTSFWVPENTPDIEKKTIDTMPNKKLYCPIQHKSESGELTKHQIKLKELVSLKFKVDEFKDQSTGKSIKQYICYICQKQLQF